MEEKEGELGEALKKALEVDVEETPELNRYEVPITDNKPLEEYIKELAQDTNLKIEAFTSFNTLSGGTKLIGVLPHPPISIVTDGRIVPPKSTKGDLLYTSTDASYIAWTSMEKNPEGHLDPNTAKYFIQTTLKAADLRRLAKKAANKDVPIQVDAHWSRI